MTINLTFTIAKDYLQILIVNLVKFAHYVGYGQGYKLTDSTFATYSFWSAK